MRLTLDISAGMADQVLFVAGPLPEPGEMLELCAADVREVVLVESHAGTSSVQVQRAYRGRAAEWPAGSVLRMPLEFTRLNGGPWWECSTCFTPVTSDGRDGHAAWHQRVDRTSTTL
jgi:hypothetical protein